MGSHQVGAGLWEWLAAADPVLALEERVALAEVIAVLQERGLDARTVDLAQFSGKGELLEALHRALEFDEWFGFNWDALEEALYGVDGEDMPERVLVCTGFRQFEERAPADAEVFLDIVRTVASTPGSRLRGCVLIH